MSETKVIYHIDDENTPYLIKVAISPDRVTLGDFKNALNRPNYKYFFKSMDDDFGVVKEEIVDDHQLLPCVNGRVVSWLVSADSSSECTDSQCGDALLHGAAAPPGAKRKTNKLLNFPKAPDHGGYGTNNNHYGSLPGRGKFHGAMAHGCPRPQPQGASVTSSRFAGMPLSGVLSEVDSASYYDSDDDCSSQLTDDAAAKYGASKPRRRRRRAPALCRTTSFSSLTDSTMSLNIVTVTLNMDSVNFLGISIVGQSNRGGDGGIYIGSIMKGGAVAMDGRIEPGDMLLEVNGHSFEHLSNDDAVRTLREAVQNSGPITLVVAKCWDPNPNTPLGFLPATNPEPVRPLDPSDWVRHTNAMRAEYCCDDANCSMTTCTSESSSLISSLPESERYANLNLTIHSDMVAIVKAMAQPDSGLEIRDRMWLKISVPNAFIGSDLVDWLFSHVEGFADRRDGRKYAANLLKAGYIRHTVNKISFSEQCYYVFGGGGGNIDGFMSSLTLDDIDSVSEVNMPRSEAAAAAPPPPRYTEPQPWLNHQHHNPYGASRYPPNVYTPPKNMYSNDSESFVSVPDGEGSAGSLQSSAKRNQTCACLVNHTVKQIKKLWELPVEKLQNLDRGKSSSRGSVKKNNGAHGGVKMATLAQFDPDIEYSTSSSGEDSDSGASSPSEITKLKPPSDGDSSEATTDVSSVLHPDEYRRPHPIGARGVTSNLDTPPPGLLGASSHQIGASRASFRMAMENL